MKISFFFTYLTVLLLSCCILEAQTNFKPAIIFLNNGDSVSGEVQYNNWKRNPQTVLFRKSGYAELQEFIPHSISGFRVANETYSSAIVQIDRRADAIDNLSFTSNVDTYRDTLFLLAIVRGPKSLYLYDDGKTHFFIGQADTFRLLEFKYFRGRSEGVDRVSKNENYVQQLKEYFSDCWEAAILARSYSYTLFSIRKMFTGYYRCKKESPEYVLPAEKPGTNFGIMGGVTRVKLDFTGTSAQISHAEFQASTGYAAGAFFDVILPRNRGKVSINNELSFVSQESEGVWRTSSDPDMYDMYTYVVGQTALMLANMLRYRFLLPTGSIYVNAGITNTVALSHTNAMVRFHKFNQSETTTHTKTPYDYGSYEFGYLGGVGMKWGKLGAEIRVEKSTGTFHYKLVGSRETKMGAFISYRIW